MGFPSLAIEESFNCMYSNNISESSEINHSSLLVQGLAHSRHSINVPVSQGLSFLICQMGTLNYVLSLLSGGGDPEEVWTVLLKLQL